ncbi:hypothetical protein QQX98_003322 [Neonectria punicea]|uniref:Prion-inhibition and propagation HeLo domain-containing protein n=1 Tax=Neonectria punicea TaxID=979145 RepID=A0ABR1HE22_9HYPO
MDVTGLAIGIGGLLKVAVEAWEFFDAAQAHAANVHYLKTRLDNQRRLFIKLAEELEFFSSSRIQKALTRSLADQIADTLRNVAHLFSNADQLVSKYGLTISETALTSTNRPNKSGSAQQGPSTTSLGIIHANQWAIIHRKSPDAFQAEIERGQDTATFWRKTKWALRDEKKTTAFVDKIAALVEELETLTRDLRVAKTMSRLLVKLSRMLAKR